MAEEMHEIRDLTGKTLRLSLPLQRVVSLVPSVTETIFALGAGERLVGRTRYCISPDPEVRSVEKAGGTKNPDIAKIVALQPDLVLANREENRREDIEALRAMGLNVYVDEPVEIEQALSQVRLLGLLLDAEVAAQVLVDRGVRALARAKERQQDLEDANALRMNPRPHVRPRTLAFIWKNPWMAAGGKTYIGSLIEALGGEHLLKRSEKRYPEISPERVRELQPDILLFPDEPYAFRAPDLDFWREEFPDVPAVAQNRLRLCDGQDLCWFGARTPDGLERLAPALAW